ncbi:hypothetical protein IW261DRAFT_1564077 [Armillaria novae-zelandiae]|uniref:Uncharacterized protein n=1 Tax=Armillaria novae-zelandiae TaxID=153914 RepID=A0AA39TCP3_9AGAR|nr:hypothetical protein IW261DRAFT_1564077 [Armillaria novae-zelandiae]
MDFIGSPKIVRTEDSTSHWMHEISMKYDSAGYQPGILPKEEDRRVSWIHRYDLAGGWFAKIMNVEELSNIEGSTYETIRADMEHEQTVGVSAAVVRSISLKNLYYLLGAIHVKLTPEEMAYLEEPYVLAVQVIIGHF